jgi:hypothetical protein
MTIAPLKARKCQAICAVENHPLALEQLTLNQIAAQLGARTDRTARIDDPMPRHGAIAGH